ncbi:type III pantothenate kinase [Thermodesulfovibrio hydrogeniphilus]
MFYAIKIGNSTLGIAKFSNPLESKCEPIFSSPLKDLNCEKLKDYIEKGHDCVVCSVVPSVSEQFFNIFKEYFASIINVNSKIKSDLIIAVDNPEKLGADRLTCCVAAFNLFRGNVAVVDAGTATTITVVTERAEIVGGAIIPGLHTMNIALHNYTALLSPVNLEEPVFLPGSNTESAIRGGIVLGTCYAIEGIIREIGQSLKANLKVVLTGGYGSLLSRFLKISHILNPYLVFEGMRLIYLKNIKN